MSPTLARLARRGLLATEDEIRSFLPAELHVAIAEAMLSGALTYKAIASTLEVSTSAVSSALRNPVAAAWIFRHLQQVIPQRLGAVDTAIFNKAVGGDVAAAKLIYSKLGEIIQRVQSVSAHIGFDPEKLTDEQLDLLIRSRSSGSGVHGRDGGLRGDAGDQSSQDAQRPLANDDNSERDSDRPTLASKDAEEVGRQGVSEEEGGPSGGDVVAVGDEQPDVEAPAPSDSATSSDEGLSSPDTAESAEAPQQETSAAASGGHRVSPAVQGCNRSPESEGA